MKSISSIHLLIVEDSEISQMLIESLFDEHPGFSTTIVSNGKEAFTALQKQQPDLILLDIMLPGMDGYEILKKLKAQETSRDIPVFMVSAKGQPEDIQKALDLGAEEYIMKPIGVNNLIDRVIKRINSLHKDDK